MSELKMSGYNTHDCHTMLNLFLAIAIRANNHPYLRMVITRMCHFFNAISKKVIDVSELDELRKEIRMTMCQLEMCFPPSVFDIVEHYMIHLADQIFVLGPSCMHYMYLYERHMVVMKGNIEEIWELNCGMFVQIPMFKCQWVKHPHGVEIDDYRFTIVDLTNVGHKDGTWVLAATVAQLFYILDPKDQKKYIVVPEKQ
jgi:hypothetical protein